MPCKVIAIVGNSDIWCCAPCHMSAINQTVYLFVVHLVVCLQSSCLLVCCAPCRMFASNQAVYLFVYTLSCVCNQSSCSLICCALCHVFAISQAVHLFVVHLVICLQSVKLFTYFLCTLSCVCMQSVKLFTYLLMWALGLLLFLTGTKEWPVTSTLTDETQLCVCACVHVCVCMSVCVCMHECPCVHLCACMYAAGMCVCVCARVRMHVCVCVFCNLCIQSLQYTSAALSIRQCKTKPIFILLWLWLQPIHYY